MVMDRGFYNTATNEKSISADKNFAFGGILSEGNSLTLFEPDLAGWVG
jgi:hypothetical protein